MGEGAIPVQISEAPQRIRNCTGPLVVGTCTPCVHCLLPPTPDRSYSIPLSSVVPACITLLLAGCGARAADVCGFNPAIPDYLFFECPAVGDYLEYLKEVQ